MANEGGKNKKYGRWNRSPSNVRYKMENRAAKNKARNVKRAEARRVADSYRLACMQNPRGLTRYIRRAIALSDGTLKDSRY